jgi:hypothetical protein
LPPEAWIGGLGLGERSGIVEQDSFPVDEDAA